jgi:uncharacterized protein (DUF2141 family)
VHDDGKHEQAKVKRHRLFALMIAIAAGVIAAVAVRYLMEPTSSEQPHVSVPLQNPDLKHEPAMAVVILDITGIQQDSGALKIAVFAEGDGFPNHELAAHLQSFEAGQIDGPTRLDSLLPGNYAIAVYHDVDGNGKLNRAAVGYPTEPYGFSNNARATFGPPPYSDAEFQAVAGDQILAIEIR